MSLLDASDLSMMRDTLEQMLPDVCSILSLTSTSDGQGGNTQTWGTATASVPCRFDLGRKESFEKITGEVLQPYSYWIVTIPHDTTIDEQNRLLKDGDLFNVEAVDEGKSWDVTRRVIARKV